MGGLSLIVEILTLLVDIGILWILIREYDFDKIAYEKELYKRKAKKKPTFENLTMGEGK